MYLVFLVKELIIPFNTIPQVRVYFHLNPKLPIPCIEKLGISFMAPPEIDFGLKPIGTVDIVKWAPFLHDAINSTISDILTDSQYSRQYI